VGVVNESLTPGAAYVTPATFQHATQRAGRVNALRFVVADRARVEAVSRALVQALEAAGAGVRVSITEQRFAAAQGGHVYILVAALGFIACTMAVVGLLGLASTLGTAVAERTREFGVLRALGARSAAVLQTVVFEGLVIALLSWGLAVLLSLGLSARVGQVLASIAAQSLVPRLSLPGALLWLALLLLGALVVSGYPARRASRLTVSRALAF
jgi:putative ABC transport system permease protein